MGDGAVEKKKAKGRTKKDQTPPFLLSFPHPLHLCLLLPLPFSLSLSRSLSPSPSPTPFPPILTVWVTDRLVPLMHCGNVMWRSLHLSLSRHTHPSIALIHSSAAPSHSSILPSEHSKPPFTKSPASRGRDGRWTYDARTHKLSRSTMTYISLKHCNSNRFIYFFNWIV